MAFEHIALCDPGMTRLITGCNSELVLDSIKIQSIFCLYLKPRLFYMIYPFSTAFTGGLLEYIHMNELSAVISAEIGLIIIATNQEYND